MDPPQDAAQRGGEGAGEGGRLIGGGFGTERLRNPPARAERERLGSGRQPWSSASWRGGRSQPRIQVFGGGLLGRGCGIRQGWGLEERGHGVLVPPSSHGYVLREDPARHRGVGGHSTPAAPLGGGHKKVGDTPRARASCHQEPHTPLDRGRRDRVLALSASPQILLQPPSPLGTQSQSPKTRCPPPNFLYTGSERAAGCQLWPCWLHGLMDRP